MCSALKCSPLSAKKGEETDRLAAVPDLAGDRLVARDDLAHARLDPLQIVGRERLLAVEIVIESVLDRGAEGHLRSGVQLLHGLGHDMRRVVPQQLQRRLMIARDDRDVGIGVDHMGEVPGGAVDHERERRLRKAGADRGGKRGAVHGRVELADAAIRKRNRDHGFRNGRSAPAT